MGRRETRNGELVKDPSILDDGTKTVISYPGGHVEGFADTFKQNFKQIYDKIAAGDTAGADFATFEDGLREMQLCEKIIQSAKERRWVSID